MLTLLLTRHGHTDRSEPEQYLGQRLEASLSERGRADAEGLADRLAEVSLDRILSSPLARAAETARIVARQRLAVETDDRLMELDYGAWEGTTVEEIERRSPADYARYDADPATFLFEGGESGEMVARRLADFIGDLLDWWEGRRAAATVLVVGHSSANRIMLAMLLGTPLRDYRRRFLVDWAGLTVLRWPSRAAGPQMLLANDLAHLRGAAGVTWS